MTIEGLDESNILIESTYQLGDSLIEISQPRQPCYKLGIRFNNPLVVKDFFQSDYPGIYIRIIKEGSVKVGDEMKLITQPVDGISVKEVHSLFHKNRKNNLLVQKAIKEKKLASGYKKDLIKMFSQ